MKETENELNVPSWVPALQVVLIMNSLAFGLVKLFFISLLSVPGVIALMLFLSWKKEKEDKKLAQKTIQETIANDGIKKTVNLMED